MQPGRVMMGSLMLRLEQLSQKIETQSRNLDIFQRRNTSDEAKLARLLTSAILELTGHLHSTVSHCNDIDSKLLEIGSRTSHLPSSEPSVTYEDNGAAFLHEDHGEVQTPSINLHHITAEVYPPPEHVDGHAYSPSIHLHHTTEEVYTPSYPSVELDHALSEVKSEPSNFEECTDPSHMLAEGTLLGSINVVEEPPNTSSQPDLSNDSSDDGRLHDGRCHDGRHHDGRHHDGRHHDGSCDNSSSDDGRRHDGRHDDGRRHDGSNIDSSSDDEDSIVTNHSKSDEGDSFNMANGTFLRKPGIRLKKKKPTLIVSGSMNFRRQKGIRNMKRPLPFQNNSCERNEKKQKRLNSPSIALYKDGRKTPHVVLERIDDNNAGGGIQISQVVSGANHGSKPVVDQDGADALKVKNVVKMKNIDDLLLLQSYLNDLIKEKSKHMALHLDKPHMKDLMSTLSERCQFQWKNKQQLLIRTPESRKPTVNDLEEIINME